MDQKEKLSDELLNEQDTDARQTEESVPTADGSNASAEEEPEDSGTSGASLLSQLGLSKKDKYKKQLADLEEQNAGLKQKLADLEDKYLRVHAEFENYKKRMQRERMEIMRLAGSDVILSLLPVLDDFTRALKQMEAKQDPTTEGVRLIYHKLKTALENRGLKAMQSVGEPYSPDLHEAISEIEAGEKQRGKVVDEVECGYYFNDKIIRHAKVIVGK
ncbi:MAG: nucleotide exchange factor GrpE [Chitinophagales bacterium]|nr:nucleotide exchange factor GrpE [Chitinophagales bacterium]MDW8393889.1 nucleotide exchange factor GrpE [Chitinophagales bacterium]